MRPSDARVPQLAQGCRLNLAANLLLVPEGAIRLHGTARSIIECCDGRRSFREIVAALQAQFSGGDPLRIEQDTASFLERLHARRVVNF